jgi:hypothetical protein
VFQGPARACRQLNLGHKHNDYPLGAGQLGHPARRLAHARAPTNGPARACRQLNLGDKRMTTRQAYDYSLWAGWLGHPARRLRHAGAANLVISRRWPAHARAADLGARGRRTGLPTYARAGASVPGLRLRHARAGTEARTEAEPRLGRWTPPARAPRAATPAVLAPRREGGRRPGTAVPGGQLPEARAATPRPSHEKSRRIGLTLSRS